MDNKFVNNFSFLHSQLKKIPITLISLSCLFITLTSCGTRTNKIILTSGTDGRDRKFSQNTLKLIDEWQVILRKEPQVGLKQINQVEQQFKEMLLANEVDIETYYLN